MFGLLDSVFQGAGGGGTAAQRGAAQADTITVDTGPTDVGGGSMSFSPASGGNVPAWVFLAALVLVLVMVMWRR